MSDFRANLDVLLEQQIKVVLSNDSSLSLHRELLTFIMENTLIIIMSQSSCYLRHPGVEPRTKQFLKRELGSELVSEAHGIILTFGQKLDMKPLLHLLLRGQWVISSTP